MVTVKEVVQFLDAVLDQGTLKDSALNGLQVEASQEVKKIAFAVDACQEIFEKAKKEGCDFLITHHGIIWGNNWYSITGVMKDRVAFLLKNDLSLYAAHLPLDLHPKYGNNAELARLLDLQNLELFGEYRGADIGFRGKLEKELSVSEFKKKVELLLGIDALLLSFGKDVVKDIAVVSGSGACALSEAVDKGVDLLLVGEYSHVHYHLAKEGGINLLAGGHYATETLGVKALMPLLKEHFGVEVVFLDAETGL